MTPDVWVRSGEHQSVALLTRTAHGRRLSDVIGACVPNLRPAAEGIAGMRHNALPVVDSTYSGLAAPDRSSLDVVEQGQFRDGCVRLLRRLQAHLFGIELRDGRSVIHIGKLRCQPGKAGL